MTEEEWNELGIPKDSLLRSINTDGEEDILSKIIDHPPHYGGTDNPYEAIKVIEAWELDFCLGNVLKYIARAGKKGEWKHKEDLQKAQWYLNRAINNIHE